MLRGLPEDLKSFPCVSESPFQGSPFPFLHVFAFRTQQSRATPFQPLCPPAAVGSSQPARCRARHLLTRSSPPGGLHLACQHSVSLGSLSQAWRPIRHPPGQETASPPQASTEAGVFSFYSHFPQAKFARLGHQKEHPASAQSRSLAGWTGSAWQRRQPRYKLLQSKIPPASAGTRRRAAGTEITRGRSRAARRSAGSRCASGGR